MQMKINELQQGYTRKSCHKQVKEFFEKQATFFKPQGIGDTTQSAALHEVRSISIHLNLMRLLPVRRTQTGASCMVWPITKYEIRAWKLV